MHDGLQTLKQQLNLRNSRAASFFGDLNIFFSPTDKGVFERGLKNRLFATGSVTGLFTLEQTIHKL